MQYHGYGYAPPAQQPKQNGIWIIACIGLAVLLAHVQRENGGFPFERIDQQNQTQPDDQSEQSDESESDSKQVNLDNVLSDAYVVFVMERLELTSDQELIFRGADDFIKARNMAGKRRYDDDNPAAQPYIDEAIKSGIKSPFVAIVRDRSITHTAPFPSTYSQLEKALR